MFSGSSLSGKERPVMISVFSGLIVYVTSSYITLKNIQFNQFPQLKLGATLSLWLFGVCVLTKMKVNPESWCNNLSIKHLRMMKVPKDNFT